MFFFCKSVGFENKLNFLIGEGLNIGEVVTDVD